VRTLLSEFERDLKALKGEFHGERGEITARHDLQFKEMTAIMSAVETMESQSVTLARSIHDTEREEIRNKNLEVRTANCDHFTPFRVAP
jgi:hypothetical protein